jgi:hypothetical protein
MNEWMSGKLMRIWFDGPVRKVDDGLTWQQVEY